MNRSEQSHVCSLDVGVGQALLSLSDVFAALLAHLAGEGSNRAHASLAPTGALTSFSSQPGSGVSVASPGRCQLFLQGPTAVNGRLGNGKKATWVPVKFIFSSDCLLCDFRLSLRC